MTRSETMSRIRGRDTGPERSIRSLLHSRGFRFRVHHRVLGICRTDIAFTRLRVAIFIDGCFWHGCPLHGVRPKNNAEFWTEKLSRNRQRDQRQTQDLEASGWSVLRFWEHEVTSSPEEVTDRISAFLESLKGIR